MASSMLITVAVALLLCWNTDQTKAQGVSITISSIEIADFHPGPNEYRAASGPFHVTCTAAGFSGTPSYRWTSTCRDCEFLDSTSQEIYRGAVHSGDTGTHTCTATSGTQSASANIVFKIVGAGIHIFNGIRSGSLPNNGLVISSEGGDYRLRMFCRSDSMMQPVGEFIGLDGAAISTGSQFLINNNEQPGEVIVYTTVSELPVDPGVYTCRIPLNSGEIRNINVGVYPSGFDTPPSINNPLVFTPGSSSSTLTCTSTGSSATTVTFVRDGATVGPLRDGESMTIGAITYQLGQTVSNRKASTYENVLTITEERSSLAHSTFTCTVGNTLGTATSQSFQIPVALTVHIMVTRTDPPGFTPEGDTEYRASSGPHTFTCTATGGAGTGAYQYQWSSTSSTFRTFPPNDVIIREAVHSGDAGTYTCTATRGGESGSANTVVTIADGELFQVEVGLVEHCVTWSSEKAKTFESSIQNAIIEVIELHCKCYFPPSNIAQGQFSCRTTTTRVTYRSTIFGIVGYNASQLLDILQDWVDSGPTIKVDWLLLDVYASCQVHISSLSAPECSSPETQPLGDPTLITSDPNVIQCVHVCLIRKQGRGICGV